MASGSSSQSGFTFLIIQLKDPEWVPDFGPAKFVPSWGATVTGARKFLIAYNVNLLATKQQAHRIALNVRECGRGTNEVREEISRLTCNMRWYS